LERKRWFSFSPIHIIAISSTIIGLLLCLLVVQMPINNLEGSSENPKQPIVASAYFRDEELVVQVRNLGNQEVEVLAVYLIGQELVDYEMLINEVIKPGETIEIETNIIKPAQRGTYTVKISFSNGLTIECDVEA